MGRLGFYFDQTFCTGCRTCQIACKDKNRLEVGTIFREVKTYEIGDYPEVQTYHYAATCNHCENPACLAACATGAIYKAEDGTVIIDREMCDGCGNCVEFCPYQVPKIMDDGKAGKCDACAYLRAKGENPACVDACPMRVLEFGDLDELAAKHGDDLVCELPILPSAELTHPSLLIKAKECAKLEGAHEFYI